MLKPETGKLIQEAAVVGHGATVAARRFDANTDLLFTHQKLVRLLVRQVDASEAPWRNRSN